MTFTLVDSGWDRILDDAILARFSPIRIISPFIKNRAVQRFLQLGRSTFMQVITRFHLGNFYDGVSDTAALRALLNAGVTIRGVQGLHAKLYLFGRHRAIVTSANLTETALSRNHEFGFVADEPEILARCNQYFEALWQQAEPDLTGVMLDSWESKLTAARLSRAARPTPQFHDYGAVCSLTQQPIVIPPVYSEAPKAFVKFFGEGDNRAEHSSLVFDEVQRSGCHWACTYPKNKRPRQVEDGSVLFMGRLVENPGDTLIFGRAVGLHYQEGRDDASLADKQERDFKEDWPHYIRVHHPEFVAGTLANGISLFALIDRFGPNAFASTKRNVERGEGNTNPRKALRQQAAVELTPEVYEWLNSELESAFQRHGALASDQLAMLDWPSLPQPTSGARTV